MDRKVDSRAMREVNRSIIADLIREAGTVSRTELSRLSSLTKPTVSTIVEELIDEGTVIEVGLRPSESIGGRRARLLEFNPTHAAYGGLYFGASATTVAVANGRGHIIAEVRRPALVEQPDAAVERAAKSFYELVEECKIPRGRVRAVGVAVGGQVDANHGRVLAPHLGWEDVALRELVSKRFNVPAVVANASDAAAVAEASFGLAQGVREFVWVHVGTGLAAGIVSGGQSFRGRSGFTGAIGSFRLSPGGARLEEIAAGPVLEAQLRELPEAHGLGPSPDVVDLLALADGGSEGARKILGRAARALAFALTHLANILNPELIVLGGPVCESSNYFSETVERTFAAELLGPERASVVRTGLPSSAAVLGSVHLAMTHALQSIRIVSRS